LRVAIAFLAMPRVLSGLVIVSGKATNDTTALNRRKRRKRSCGFSSFASVPVPGWPVTAPANTPPSLG
jgi:hypothetical protein